MSRPEEELQRQVSQVLLGTLGDVGFALAGAGAIRAHGITDRPTHDVDLFTKTPIDEGDFLSAIDRGGQALEDAGYGLAWLSRTGTFARLRVHAEGGAVLDVDFAVNWRVDPPVRMSVGPVLSERDAVAGKLSAVYSRGEVRDFLDLDAIRASGRYTDSELLGLGREHDDGFDTGMFAAQLSRVLQVDALEAEEYGISPDAFTAMQHRTLAWAIQLRDTLPPSQTMADAVRSLLDEREQRLGSPDTNPITRRPEGPDRGIGI